jgi:hypothetical protein
MSSPANALPGVPDVESPLFETIFKTKEVSPQTLDIARRLREDGYAVFDFPDPDLDQLGAEIIRTLDPKYDWHGWRKGDVPNLRIQDAWSTLPAVKQIACNANILKLLSDLYGRRAFPFQTLNFPVGTQQHFHSDSVHFSCCPERFMAGVWVALEDIDSDNGPLIYYPGSHKLPVFTNEHIGVNPDPHGPPNSHYPLYMKAWEEIVDALDLKPAYFHAKKGQALIWAANLLHGGAAQKDINRTRYSQVTHYYFDDCCYYTPLGSVPFLGAIEFRNNIIDISTGRHVPNKLNGTEVSPAASQSGPSPSPAKTGVHRLRSLLHRSEKSQRLAELPPGFDGAAYLKANPDVAAAGVDAAEHWLNFGHREGRPLR